MSSHICKKAVRVFSTAICVVARDTYSYTIPKISRKCWQRKLVTSSALRLVPEMEPSSDDEQKRQLLETLGNFKWLGSKSPCFPVVGNKVRVLTEPHIFYKTLIEKTSQASKRITFASLYLGTGKHELDLVKALESALEKNQDLNLKVLLDATRGSRGTENNSRTMLLPLVQSFSQQCSVYFYHTPALRGMLKKILPERWNEIVGLQHMKIYIFDDSLLISGANLSHDYFTNRQDRYIIIDDCKDLVDFFDQLVETVCQFSFQMNENNNFNLNSDFPHHPYESNHLEFIAEAKQRISSLFEKQLERTSSFPVFQWPNPGLHDTWIFPFVQMGQLSIYMDNLLTRQILEKVPQNAELCLATGYFNLTQDYMDSLLEASQPNIHILMAHPLANGFFGARGFAGGIPSAYTLLAYQFYRRVLDRALAARIRLWEYQRQNWTFHAKGLWISFNRGDPRPCFTLVGSPNFGYRSVYRDLEAQLAVVTINSSLRDQLHQERKNLFQQADMVSGTTFDHPERKIPLWVRFVIKVFRRFF